MFYNSCLQAKKKVISQRAREERRRHGPTCTLWRPELRPARTAHSLGRAGPAAPTLTGTVPSVLQTPAAAPTRGRRRWATTLKERRKSWCGRAPLVLSCFLSAAKVRPPTQPLPTQRARGRESGSACLRGPRLPPGTPVTLGLPTAPPSRPRPAGPSLLTKARRPRPHRHAWLLTTPHRPRPRRRAC